MNRAERRQQKKLAKKALQKAKNGGGDLPPSVNLEAMVQPALAAHQAGRLDEAESLYKQILSIQPNFFDALHLSGVLAHQRGRSEEAVERIAKAIEINPTFVDAHKNLATVLMALARFGEAEVRLQTAISLKADYAELHFNLGNVFLQTDRFEDATNCYRRAVSLNPGYLEARLNLANVLREQGDMGAAEDEARTLITQAPKAWEAHNMLGILLIDKGSLDEALEHLDQALVSNPGSIEALHNRGIVLAEQGRYREAEDSFRAVLKQDPAHHDAHVNVGLINLLHGRYAHGWQGYAHRRGRPRGVLRKREYQAPLWDGGALSGKRIFVYPEQGLGDFIQFVRFVPRLASMGGEVILEVPTSLQDMMPKNWIGVAYRPPSDAAPDFDCHASVMDLPAILNLDENGLKSTGPYLHPAPSRVDEWSTQFDDSGDTRVGVVWAGNPKHRNDHNRSIEAMQFAALLGVEGVRFYSLQVGRPIDDLACMGEGQITDLQNRLTDYHQTAAAIANLDVVISVDTSVAHLAGAMGRTVWTLLPYIPDWRWGLEGDSTPWYPTMRLFRQGAERSWVPVLEEVREALEAL